MGAAPLPSTFGFNDRAVAADHVRKLRLRHVIATVALVSACTSGLGQDLQTAEDRWESSGVSSYELEVQLTCLCPRDVAGPFQITVRSNEIKEIRWEGAAIEASAATPVETFTVEGLFGTVREHLTADDLTVRYDDELGYPAFIAIDQDTEAVDDEWSVSATLTTP